MMAELYPVLRELHYLTSRGGLIIGAVMLLAAIYIGLIRRGDVTRVYRIGVYFVIGYMVVSALMGLIMYAYGGRPYDPVHLVYGAGAVLSLPFFVFVEVTAKKRPAMGSYIWAFALMIGIVIRSIATGAAG
ncbi:MAG: hypothetical protein HC828_11820 [Blastochloris sp.]|nr:hypothetical protein [Blastochloris sp.]